MSIDLHDADAKIYVASVVDVLQSIAVNLPLRDFYADDESGLGFMLLLFELGVAEFDTSEDRFVLTVEGRTRLSRFLNEVRRFDAYEAQLLPIATAK